MAAEFLNGNGYKTKLKINVQTETSRKIERSQEAKEDSITKAFDDIIFLEDTFAQRGFIDGRISGLIKQGQEGYSLGTQKGFEIGSEVGQCRGFALVWLQHLKNLETTASDSSSNHKYGRCIKVLQKLLKSTDEVPSTNPRVDTKEDSECNPVDVWDSLREMRANLILAKKLLGIDETPITSTSSSLTGNQNIKVKPKTLNW